MSKPSLVRQNSGSPTNSSSSSDSSRGGDPGFKWQKAVEHVGVFYLVEGSPRFEYTSAPGKHGLLLPTGTEEAWTEACHIIKTRLLVAAQDLMKENRENFCWAKWEDSLTYEKTADSLNCDIGPTINKQIVPLGFRVDAGTDTVTIPETNKKGLFARKTPKNVIYIRITRLSLRRVNRAFAKTRPPHVPVSPQRRNQDPLSQMYYPAPQKKFIPRMSPARRRLPPNGSGLVSPRGNTPIRSPRAGLQKQVSIAASPLSRQHTPVHHRPTSPRHSRSPRGSPGRRMAHSPACRASPPGQQPNPTLAHASGSQARLIIPPVPDLNSGDAAGRSPQDTSVLSESQSSLQNSADLSKIVSLVADVVVDMISENSGKLDTSNNSLTLDGVFDKSPKTSPKSKKKSCAKQHKSMPSLADGNGSLENEVRSALVEALHTSKKKLDHSAPLLMSDKTSCIDTVKNSGKQLEPISEKRDSKKTKSLKKGDCPSSPKGKSSKSTNKKKAKGAGKPKKVRSKAVKDETTEEPVAVVYKDNSHLDRMSESADIHFLASEFNDDDEAWTNTERTLELSLSSLGAGGDMVKGVGSARRDASPRRSHAV